MEKTSIKNYLRKLYSVALRGMNYGNGGDIKVSGELYTLKYIQKKIGNDEEIVLFDVGANIGDYTLELSRLFTGNNVRIHSFEPSKYTYEKMLENIKGLNNIKANNFGFSDNQTCLKLFTNMKSSGLASVYQRKLDHLDIQMDQSEEITLTTIDDYCNENTIDKIHFLKLDVEGHEIKVLQGAAKMIAAKKIDFIQFEFGGCNIDSRTYFQDFFYFLKENYKIYRIVENGLFPIYKYKEGYEIFTTINYLAERKAIIS